MRDIVVESRLFSSWEVLQQQHDAIISNSGRGLDPRIMCSNAAWLLDNQSQQPLVRAAPRLASLARHPSTSGLVDLVANDQSCEQRGRRLIYHACAVCEARAMTTDSYQGVSLMHSTKHAGINESQTRIPQLDLPRRQLRNSKVLVQQLCERPLRTNTFVVSEYNSSRDLGRLPAVHAAFEERISDLTWSKISSRRYASNSCDLRWIWLQELNDLTIDSPLSCITPCSWSSYQYTLPEAA
jgi:hypothetical protein